MSHDEKKVLMDQIFILANKAEAKLIDSDDVIRELWALGNELRNELREDAQK